MRRPAAAVCPCDGKNTPVGKPAQAANSIHPSRRRTSSSEGSCSPLPGLISHVNFCRRIGHGAGLLTSSQRVGDRCRSAYDADSAGTEDLYEQCRRETAGCHAYGTLTEPVTGAGFTPPND
jgi:hypothetical protein